MAIRVTEADLLDALAAATAGAGPEDARTLMELSIESDIDERKVRRALHRLHHAGRLVVHKVHRIGIDGRRTTVPAYTILPDKPDKPARRAR